MNNNTPKRHNPNREDANSQNSDFSSDHKNLGFLLNDMKNENDQLKNDIKNYEKKIQTLKDCLEEKVLFQLFLVIAFCRTFY